jgi:PAP2 superfamily
MRSGTPPHEEGTFAPLCFTAKFQSQVRSILRRMRFYEWLTAAFLLFFAVLSWMRPLERRRRIVITGFAVVGITAILTLRSSVLRDWLPLIFIPFTYFQTGQFVLPLNKSFQSLLERIDQKIAFPLPGPIMLVLELAYLFCYPLVPAGLIALYLTGMGDFAAEFWNVVLPPAYACYATFPFVQTLPPRSTEGRTPWQPRFTRMRSFNAFVLRYISTQANTFPSGHVAASVAVALELLAHARPIGVVFAIIAALIAAGAFFGRYHYALDIVIGAPLALLSFILFGPGM